MTDPSTKAKFWADWGINGMPKDKQKLAEASWHAGWGAGNSACDSELIEALDELNSSMNADFPRFEEGSKAQADWARRRADASEKATSLVAKYRERT